MIYEAHELQNRFRAGLVLCGQNADGELEWIGSKREWAEFRDLENDYASSLETA